MSMQTEPRFRINASQSVKNIWTLNATVEYESDKIEVSNDPKDSGKTVKSTLGLQLLSLIKETEKVFKEDNRTMAGDL